MPIIKGPFNLFVYDISDDCFKSYTVKIIQEITYNQYTPSSKNHYFCIINNSKSSRSIRYEVNKFENKLFVGSGYITMVTRDMDINNGPLQFASEIEKYYTEEIDYMERNVSKINDKIAECMNIIKSVSNKTKIGDKNALG